jgi:hypothetical protein
MEKIHTPLPSDQSEAREKQSPVEKMESLEGRKRLTLVTLDDLEVLSDGTRSRKSIESRFWSRIDKKGPDDCWMWTGSIYKTTGYGSLQVDLKNRMGRIWTAHRIAFLIHHGSIDNGLCCCHICDCRRCCNWRHLFLATQNVNLKDAASKGRMAHGTQHCHAKLNDEKVRYMRSTYAKGETTQQQLGDQFGVSREVARAVINRKTWRAVE